MSIHSQDRYAIIALVAILATWFVANTTLGDLSLYDSLFGGIGLAVFLPVIYLIKRRSSYLNSLIKKYSGQKNQVDLNMAAVQAAYGQYRLALVAFKIELKKNPNDETLQEIVELMEELENGNKFFR